MPEEIAFHPCTNKELQTTRNVQGFQTCQYECGACGLTTNARVLASMSRNDPAETVRWMVCACPKSEPTIMVENPDKSVSQLPAPRKFHVGKNWPLDLGRLYEESAKSFAAGAFTASSMVSRKILMACAVNHGAKDGQNFTEYVEYITTKVLTFAPAKTSIDVIRTIGNDANHNVEFVDRANAERALSIVTYMLNAIYSLPSS